MTGPITYNETAGGNLPDQIDRYRELADHDTMARAIATLKARGTYQPSEHVNEERFPPLTAAEHLEMLALGERIARYYRHPSQVTGPSGLVLPGSRSRPLPTPRPKPPGPPTGSGPRASTSTRA